MLVYLCRDEIDLIISSLDLLSQWRNADYPDDVTFVEEYPLVNLDFVLIKLKKL